MLTVYKFLTYDMTSRGDTHWVIGETKVLPNPSRRPRLCSGDVFHAYKSVGQALLYRFNHLSGLCLLYAAETPKIVVEDYDKVGVLSLTLTAGPLLVPVWSSNSYKRGHYRSIASTLLFGELLTVLRGMVQGRVPDHVVHTLEEWARKPEDVPADPLIDFMDTLVHNYHYALEVKQRLKSVISLAYDSYADDLFHRDVDMHKIMKLVDLNAVLDRAVVLMNQMEDEHVDN